MGQEPQASAAELTKQSAYVIEDTLKALYHLHPSLKSRYGPAGKQRCREDIAYHLCTLTEAMAAGDAEIFVKYVEWGKIVLTSRKVRTDDLLDCLLLMQDSITSRLSADAAKTANIVVQLAIEKFASLADSLPTFLPSDQPTADAANAFLAALISSDRNEARKILRAEKQRGASYGDLCRYIFEPVQREIGRLWQLNHISVAQEHYCTGSAEILMSEMRDDDAGAKNGHLFVGACVAGEQHSIGIRMVSEIMEAGGWTVYFTGANTPTASLVDLVKRLKVQVLGISCATVLNLLALRELMQSVRQASAETKIMVGGRIFNESPGLWKKLNADGYADSAAKVPAAALKLVQKKRASARRARALLT